MLVDPDNVSDKADFFDRQPDNAGGRGVPSDKDQVDLPFAVDQGGALGKGDVWGDDQNVVKLCLDFWFAFEAVADPFLEIFCVARHLFVGALVGQNFDRHEILVAQRVAAVVVGVDQVEKGSARVFVVDLGAPIDGLRWDQRGIYQNDPFFGVDEPWGAATVVGVEKDPRCQLFTLAQTGHPDPYGTASSCHRRTRIFCRTGDRLAGAPASVATVVHFPILAGLWASCQASCDYVYLLRPQLSGPYSVDRTLPPQKRLPTPASGPYSVDRTLLCGRGGGTMVYWLPKRVS